MRKTLIGAAALLLSSGGLALAPIANAQELGSVNVQAYCGNVNSGPSQGTPGTERDPGNAYSWRCTYQGGGLDPKHTTPVDMNLACREQYGPGAWAKPLDPHNANSWRCYR